MQAFELAIARSLSQATEWLAEGPGSAMALAGGTDLLDLMKERIAVPRRVVSLGSIPGLEGVERTEEGGVRIGALTKLERLRTDPAISTSYPVLAEALGTVATPQIRNMATLGGNLCQRPRCWYLRGDSFDCLRKGGDTCFAVDGENEHHAILGGSGCFIIHPSDAGPALIALDAAVHLAGPEGERSLPLESFYVGPEEEILQETVLQPGELVAALTLPPPAPGARSRYVKLTQRGAWDFALASAAVRLDMEGGKCRQARICLGGVAPVPWRAPAAEEFLAGQKLDERAASRAAEEALRGSAPLSKNAYKVRLARTAVRRAILQAVSGPA
jgi:xanthine dehydrogenase YagS FAD-binding subunit